jgi:hypothetical protein
MSNSTQQEFNARTTEAIGYYVYALIDPRDQKPFYVGKGMGNRVFAHSNDALSTEVQTDKLDTVREIVSAGLAVKHVVMRHGLDEKTALIVESTLLDFASFFHVELTNLVAGHHASTFGAMTTDELNRKFNAPPLENLGKDCVIININKRYRDTKGTQSFYDVTKGYWAMANPLNSNRKFVLAEFKSFIVEVFEVEKWYPVETGKRTRWGFEGHVAPSHIRELYFNRKIYKQQGAANPISNNLQQPKPVEVDF